MPKQQTNFMDGGAGLPGENVSLSSQMKNTAPRWMMTRKKMFQGKK